MSIGSSISVPNVIYNRFDLFRQDYKVLKIQDTGKEYCVEYYYENENAYIGTWLGKVPSEVLMRFCKMILCKHNEVQRVILRNSLASIGLTKQKNHFRICLPDSESELDNRLSKKGRYNIRREKKMLEMVGMCKFEEYTADNVTDYVFQKYFQLKQLTHQVDYHMTKSEYINHYHVSNIYSLSVDNEIIAIVLSCEQCPIVYIENLTYDQKYSKYSPGQILYDYYLKILIKKGYHEIYLAGGDLDYKKRYGSSEDIVYDCIVYRNRIDQSIEEVKRVIKKIIRYEA